MFFTKGNILICSVLLKKIILGCQKNENIEGLLDTVMHLKFFVKQNVNVDYIGKQTFRRCTKISVC